jgi:hypothetical protein
MRATNSPRHALRRARPVGVVALLIYPRRTGGDVTVTIQADPRELPTRLALETAHDDELDLFVLYDDSDAPRFVTYLYQGTLDSPPPTQNGAPPSRGATAA